VLSAVSLFSALTSSWVTTSAIRFVPGYEEDGQLGRGVGLLLTLFLVTLLAGLVVAVAAGLVVTWRGSLSGGFVAVAIALCAATASHDFLLGLLRSRRQAAAFTMLTSANGIGSFVLAVGIAVLVRPSAEAVVAGFLLSVLVVAPMSARQALRGTAPAFPNLRSVEVREILRYGMPAVVISGLTWVTSLSDRYVLAATQGEHAVGIYAASRDLSDKVLVLLNTLFLLASTPVGISVWERDGEEGARRYVADLTRYYLLIALPTAVGISVLARPLITFLADVRYHDGYRLVPFVTGGALFAGLAARYTLGLHFRKRTGLLSLCYGGAALANVGLNVLLVPRFGYMAAAAGNLASLLLLLLVTRWVSLPLFRWPFPAAAAGRLVVATAVMGVVVWLSVRGISTPGLQLALGVPVGIVTYTLAILGVGVLGPEERTALARQFRLNRRSRPPQLP
jgi:O-antigen/teichoic acid export membrane protein